MKIKFVPVLLILPLLLFANATVGRITALQGKADIKQGDITRAASLGSELVKHDQIVTKEKSKVQVIFQDETIITIGKNSQFSVDEYISDGADSEVQLSLFKGAMRTITGKIGKANPQKFKVKTKTATIGIRGTNFIIIVIPGQGHIVVCTLGAITVQGNGGLINVPSGFMTRVNLRGEVQAVQAFNAGELAEILTGAFGIITSKKSGTTTNQNTTEPVANTPAAKVYKATVLTTETTITEDGTTVTKATLDDGSSTEKITMLDGTVMETITTADGTITETVMTPEGSVIQTVMTTDGMVTTVETTTTTEGVITTETITTTDGTVIETVTMADGTAVQTVTLTDGTTTTATIATADTSVITVEDTLLLDTTGVMLVPTVDSVTAAVTSTASATNTATALTSASTSTAATGTPVYVSGVASYAYAQYFNTWGDPDPIAFGDKPYTLSYGIDPVAQILTPNSAFTNFTSSTQFILNEQLASFVSVNDFATTFASVVNSDPYWTSVIDTGKPSENYMRTLPDFDAYGEITWGEWSVPLNETWDDGVNPPDQWTATYSGYWVAGTMTPVGVIDGYRTNNLTATYNGSFIGRAIDTDWNGGVYATTNFSGSSVSNVDFGAGTVNTALSFSIGADTYDIGIGGTISGNTFSDNGAGMSVLVNGSTPTGGYTRLDTKGAFYGASGKTVAGTIGFDLDNYPNTNNYRSFNGVYEGSTTDLP